MDCYFFLYEPYKFECEILTIPECFEFEIWRPNIFQIKPLGLSIYPFGVWWLFHILHLFFNRQYALSLIRHQGRIVHRSCIFPGSFKFPFMSSTDLQVGDTWTASEFRSNGLACCALSRIVNTYSMSKIWYITNTKNTPSIQIAKRCGFRLYAKGRRNKMHRFSLSSTYCFEDGPYSKNKIYP